MSTSGGSSTPDAQAPEARSGLRPATLDDAEAMCVTVAEGLATYREWAPDWTPPPGIDDPDVLRERWTALGVTGHVNADVTAHVAHYPATDEPGAVHLMHLFVRAHRRGTGVAAALLALAVADAQRAGMRAMRLRTPTGNARGIAFYRREGWAQHGDPLPAELPGTGLGLEHIWLRRAL